MEDGDYPATNDTRTSGSKRSFDYLENDENDTYGSKKGKVEESDPEVAAAMIFSLQESLQECKNDLASCQNELESAKTEINKWKSAFEKESFVPARTSPEPGFVIDYIEQLRSSETTLKEQLEIAQMKEVEVDENRCLGLDTLPNHGGNSSSPVCPSTSALLDELQAAKMLIAKLEEVHAVDMVEMRKKQAEHVEFIELAKLVLQKYPNLVPPPAPEDADE